MARHQRDLKREQIWRQHIQKQRVGGLTVRDYCCDHDLHESAFYFWRRVIAERDCEAANSSTPAFVPITVVQSPAAPNPSPIDIHLKCGSRLRVRSGCDRELLAAVLTLLEGRSC